MLGFAGVEGLARRWLAVAASVMVAVVVAGSALTWLISRASLVHVESVLRNGQVVILLAAAGLALLNGRWAARTSAGFASAALLVLAVAGLTSVTSLGKSGFGPVMSTGIAALAVALLLAAAAAPEVNDTASFRRLFAREGCPVALLVLVALTPVIDAVLTAGNTLPLPSRMALSALVTAGWFIAGTRVLRLDRPRLRWLPAVSLLLGVAAAVRAFVGLGSGFLLVALALEAAASIFAFVGAAMKVRAVLVGTANGMTSMLQDLSTMRDQDSRRRAEEVERLHEVRSLLAGLSAATGSLRKYEETLDPGVRRRLQDAVAEELIRLNQMIDPAPPEVTDIEALDLEAVVTSVLVAEREQGLVVTTDLADISVWGGAAEIATLVSDLLVNARVHAPGSAVRLTARTEGGMVVLEARDWGPGLSAVEADCVFQRAYRGARPIANGIPGSGLGLYTARKLARQMHGDLRLRAPAGGGCCFVVTLPVARHGNDRAPLPPQVDRALESPTHRTQLVEIIARKRLVGAGLRARGRRRPR